MSKSNENIKSKLADVTNNLIETKGYIAFVDVFQGLGYLSREDYEAWRMKKIPYLERCIKINLSKISFIMKLVRTNSTNGNLKSSWTAYKSWGKKTKIDLRFSKTGDPNIETLYATHFIKPKKAPKKLKTTPEPAKKEVLKPEQKTVKMRSFTVRNLEQEDYAAIIPLVNDWWGGRDVASMLPRLFFTHFQELSFGAEKDGELIGFLVGFRSQTKAKRKIAYIHFVGVHPDFRKVSVGSTLYERFFGAAKKQKCMVVHSITSTWNKDSIAYHKRMGFEIRPGEGDQDGIPFTPDYDGPGKDRVLFQKKLENTSD